MARNSWVNVRGLECGGSFESYLAQGRCRADDNENSVAKRSENEASAFMTMQVLYGKVLGDPPAFIGIFEAFTDLPRSFAAAAESAT